MTEVHMAKSLLSDCVNEHGDVPAAVWAAYDILGQLEDYICELDSIIGDKLGRLKIIIPRGGLFHFDVPTNQNKIIDVTRDPK